jgi:oligosaccharide repeat unit polymerase
MTCILSIYFLLALTAINFMLGNKRVLFPPFIFSAIWLIDLCVFVLSPISLNKVHAVTWWVISLGAFLFSVGGWMTKLFPAQLYFVRLRELARPEASRLGRMLLLSVCLLAVPVMAHDVVKRGTGSDGSVLAAARQSYVDSMSEGNARDFLISNLPLYTICVTVIFLIEGMDSFFWIALSLSMVCCILTTGRTFVLMLLSAVAAAAMLKKSMDNPAGLLKIAVIPISVFVSLFVGLIFTSKDVSNYSGNVGAILSNFILAYVVTPIPALDYVLTHSSEYLHAAHHSFGFLSRIASLMGYDVRATMGPDSYILVPLPANVYTIYKFFYTDFGFIGMILTLFVIGFLQSAVYWRAVAGGKISLFISSILVYPVIISIFDDAFSGSSLLFFIKASMLAAFYFLVMNRFLLGIKIPKLSLGLPLLSRRNV